ncbi:MAG: transglycosylase SLT domain-containing protein [Betaproteobacteria bacterium]
MTQINSMYRLIKAVKHTYTMVRNSTKLIAACVVLGVVNQACAVGTIAKQSKVDAPASAEAPVVAAPTHPATTAPAPSAVRPAAVVAVTIATDPAKAIPVRAATSAPAPMPVGAAATPAIKPAAAPRTSGYAEAKVTSAPYDGAGRSTSFSEAPGAPHPVPPTKPAIEATAPLPPAQSEPLAASSTASTETARPTGTAAPLPSVASIDSTSVPEGITPVTPATTRQTPASYNGTQVISATPVAMQGPASVPIVYSDTPKEIVGSLWDRIRAGFAMPELESPLVQRHMTWYLNRPEYLQRMVERSRRYLHYIVEQLEQRGMPLEIALLPMIESAYNPVAYSSAHASGIWQFIPATGRRYGLEQNWWYDGRRDVTAATDAALDYLQKLHGDFGDWELALAAYNWGEGAVSRAITKNKRNHKPTDYSSLKMPKETAHYLPKLQAVKNLIADPARYGVELEDIPNQPYFIRVNAPSDIDVKRAAQLAEVPIEEFRYLNPAHNRPVISSDGDRMLLLPVEKAEVFATNLEANSDPLVSWQTVTLKRNESLDKVAARYGISVNTLMQVNGLSHHRRMRPGQTLIVPTPAAMQKNAKLGRSLDPVEYRRPSAGPEMELYRVKQGDTLLRIAKQHRVSTRQIERWNFLKRGKIAVGQQLTLYPDMAPTHKKRSTRTKTAKAHKAGKATHSAQTKASSGTHRKQVARN